jgi:hypothetical protein
MKYRGMSLHERAVLKGVRVRLMAEEYTFVPPRHCSRRPRNGGFLDG